MEVSPEEFCRAFPLLAAEVVAVKKVYLTKYILFQLNAEGAFGQLCLEKRTEDLRKVYKQVRRLFPNFPFSADHRDNFYRLMAFAREELEAARPELTLALHRFFFCTKNQNVLKREHEKELERAALLPAGEASIESEADALTQLSFSTLTEPPAETRALLVPKTAGFAPKSHGDEALLERIFAKLFREHNGRLLTNFQSMSLQEKLIASINYAVLSQEIFEVQFRCALDAQATAMFATFADGAVYFYDEKRKFLADKRSFVVFFLLVKIEQLWLEDAGEGHTAVVIANQAGERSFEFRIPTASCEHFVALLVYETLREDSPLVREKRLPEPLGVIGYTVLYLDQSQQAAEDPPRAEQSITLHSAFLQLATPRFCGQKRLVLPVLNVFDIFELAEGGRELLFETLSLCALQQGVKEHIGELESCRVSAARLFGYLHAYVHPPLENYHESRFQSGNITSSLKELQIASFRLKRMLALRDSLVKITVEFGVFKYPLFTTLVLLACMVVTVALGLGYLLLLLGLALTLYFHPAVQPPVDRFLFAHAFAPRRLNAHYRSPRYLPEREKRKLFHLDLNNMQGKAPSSGIKGKVQGALDLGAKVPAQMHMIVDVFEKAKNITLWRDHRKTQLFVFVLVLAGFAGNVLGKDNVFLLYCAVKFLYDVGYYKRVGVWNREVLRFLIGYLIQRENPQFEGSSEQFFARYRNDEPVKLAFSKRFAEFVLKHVDIRTDDDFWCERFSEEKILEELQFSTRRILIPFYERQRRPNSRYLSLYFWLSTPSDFYYHNLSTRLFTEDEE